MTDMMRETGAVISGSAALALLHPLSFEPNDLDFYVSSPGYSYVLRFIEDFGYKIVPNPLPVGEYDSGRLVVTKLVHPVSQRSINVITSTHDLGTPADIITTFHSTLVMNYIAYHGVIALYPEWTLNNKGLILNDNPNNWACFAKYEHRNFNLYRDINELEEPSRSHCCQESPYCPLTKRSLHDGFCFYEPFPGSDRGVGCYERNVKWTLSGECLRQG
jgi:hypothetical protein